MPRTANAASGDEEKRNAWKEDQNALCRKARPVAGSLMWRQQQRVVHANAKSTQRRRVRCVDAGMNRVCGALFALSMDWAAFINGPSP
jgi:hypothetical protein